MLLVEQMNLNLVRDTRPLLCLNNTNCLSTPILKETEIWLTTLS